MIVAVAILSMVPLVPLAIAGDTHKPPVPSGRPVTVTVTVTGPPSRICRELIQELETSGFSVDRAAAPAKVRGVDAAARTGRLLVTVDETTARLRVFLQAPGATLPRFQFDVALAAKDRSSQRRSFIALVEKLRPLAAAPSAWESSDGPTRSLPATSSERTARADGVNDAGAPDGSSARAAVPTTLATIAVTNDRKRQWRLGGGTALSFAGDDTGVTNHAVLTGQFLASPRYGLWTRLLWPISESTLQTARSVDRLWTWGGDLGTSIEFTEARRTVRPYANFGLGLRFLLADRTFDSKAQSGVGRKLGGRGSVALGARVRTSARTLVFFQVEAGYALAMASDYAVANDVNALSGWSVASEIGMLFDY